MALGDVPLRVGIARDPMDETDAVALALHRLDQTISPPPQADDSGVDHVRCPYLFSADDDMRRPLLAPETI